MALSVERQRKDCRWPGGEMLKTALKEQGRGSQRDLATKLNVRDTTIYAWTVGDRRPPKDVRPVLFRLFGIPESAWNSAEDVRRERERKRRLDAL